MKRKLVVLLSAAMLASTAVTTLSYEIRSGDISQHIELFKFHFAYKYAHFTIKIIVLL